MGKGKGQGELRDGKGGGRNRKGKEGGGKGTEGMGGTGRERKEKRKGGKRLQPQTLFMAPPLFRLVLGLGLGSVLGLGLPTA